jgi:hypothetical protein
MCSQRQNRRSRYKILHNSLHDRAKVQGTCKVQYNSQRPSSMAFHRRCRAPGNSVSLRSIQNPPPKYPVGATHARGAGWKYPECRLGKGVQLNLLRQVRRPINTNLGDAIDSRIIAAILSFARIMAWSSSNVIRILVAEEPARDTRNTKINLLKMPQPYYIRAYSEVVKGNYTPSET